MKDFPLVLRVVFAPYPKANGPGRPDKIVSQGDTGAAGAQNFLEPGEQCSVQRRHGGCAGFRLCCARSPRQAQSLGSPALAVTRVSCCALSHVSSPHSARGISSRSGELHCLIALRAIPLQSVTRVTTFHVRVNAAIKAPGAYEGLRVCVLRKAAWGRARAGRAHNTIHPCAPCPIPGG